MKQYSLTLFCISTLYALFAFSLLAGCSSDSNNGSEQPGDSEDSSLEDTDTDTMVDSDSSAPSTDTEDEDTGSELDTAIDTETDTGEDIGYSGITFIEAEDTPCSAMNFDGIPIATTVEESKQYLEARIRRVVTCKLGQGLEPYPVTDDDRGRFTQPANARLVTRRDTASVNDIILSPDTKQWALYGSTFEDLAPLCVRKGDYDFTTQALVRTAYIDLFDMDLLWPESRHKIAWDLLTANGTDHHIDMKICGFDYPDTENHVLMTETSRYLTNQLLLQEELSDSEKAEFDNSQNGFNEWMLNHFKQFFVNYFEEYNSKPYQGYAVMPIDNMYAFSEDPKVRLASRMLLDFLTAVFAVQSNGLRRLTPFRRQERYAEGTVAIDGDGETGRMALLAGNYQYLKGDNRPIKKYSPQYGGVAGDGFDDQGSLPEHPLVSQVEIRAGERVNRIRLTLRDGTELSHGGDGGTAKSLSLAWDEHLKKMVVHTGQVNGSTRVFYVEFHTTNGRVLSGGTKTEDMTTIEAPEGWHITGFRGRSGSELDRIGVIFTPIDYLYDDGTRLGPYGDDKMLAAAITGYRVPDMILDLVIRKDHNSYFQKIKHDGVELYSSSKSFLINAGGVFNKNFMFGSNEQHGWARPSALMPTADPSSDFTNWIRILDNNDSKNRYNHSIARNFACGTNVFIPLTIPRQCIEQDGNWYFVNFTAPACPLDYGFYAVVYKEDCDSDGCKDLGENFGFFEAREAEELTYEEFKDAVLSKNDHRDYDSGKTSTYEKTDGETIVFETVHKSKWTWGIISIDGVVQNRNIESWPLAEGDIINASRDGRVVVTNPYLRKRLILDMSDHLNPQRIEEDF